MGYDFNKCSSKQELEIISDSLLDEGVTGFNASIVCESHHDTLNLLQMYEGNTPDNLIGVHLEGPVSYTHLQKIFKMILIWWI